MRGTGRTEKTNSMKLRRRSSNRRRGTTVVEMALVAPPLFLLLIGMVVGGLGVFRYHQVIALAHEGARWASVRGPEQQRQSRTAPSKEKLYKEVIQPRMSGLEKDKLLYELVWNEDKTLVTVTVRYEWMPEAFFKVRPLTCTASALVTN